LAVLLKQKQNPLGLKVCLKLQNWQALALLVLELKQNPQGLRAYENQPLSFYPFYRSCLHLGLSVIVITLL
jgi:hypothetical protein